VPDDDRKRRRLGDATKGRIADLADGWTLDNNAPAGPESNEAPSPRRKQKTIPPPPPGSAARRELEEAFVEAKDSSPGLPRAVDPAPAATKPPPLPKKVEASGPAKLATGTPTSTKAPLADASGPQYRRASSPAPNEIAARLGTGRGSGSVPAMRGNQPSSSGGADAASTSGVIEVAPKAKAAAPAAAKPAPAPVSPPPRPNPPFMPLPADARPPEPPRPPVSLSGPIALLPPVIVDDQVLETVPDVAATGKPGAKLAVPRGEFDDGQMTIDEDKLRLAMAQATIVRDAADALLGLPAPAPPRDDPTSSGSTSRFERGDPTTTDADRGDATAISSPSHAAVSAGKLRAAAALRRKRGLLGDVRYVATAILGVRRARRDLEHLEKREDKLGESHRRHLITLGRAAVTSDMFHHPALGNAREQLSAVEEERSQHAGQVAAADAELQRTKRDRDAKAKQHVIDLAALDVELADVAKKMVPLEKEAAAARKKTEELREALVRVERKIVETEGKLVSVRGEKLERSEILAEIASLKADRQAIKRDEPRIAGEVDAINPRIAAIEASRAEAIRKKDELAKAEVEDKRRVDELLTAIGAKRKVVERAMGDAEAARDKILFELGERLYVDRPEALVAQLSPIDEIDLELGEADRRIMELREILSSVDKSKLARGIILLVTVAALLSAFVAWLVVNLVGD
jgi:hypothetical protein